MLAEKVIEKVVLGLREIPGIEAIVLGGSRATGRFNEKSDLDLGIYYLNPERLDLDKLNALATSLDDSHREGLVTPIGGWGPWINGGGWLTINQLPTDFLLRDLTKVTRVIEDCLNENITMDYQPGHPHGFVNVIYASEIFHCKILWDPMGYVKELKTKVTPYPAKIKTGILQKFLWEAGFSAVIGEKSLTKKDIGYTAGCIYRAASCLIQVIYALNETFLMNEKGALAATEAFEILPKDFKERLEGLYEKLRSEPEGMKEKMRELKALVEETEKLCK